MYGSPNKHYRIRSEMLYGIRDAANIKVDYMKAQRAVKRGSDKLYFILSRPDINTYVTLCAYERSFSIGIYVLITNYL